MDVSSLLRAMTGLYAQAGDSAPQRRGASRPTARRSPALVERRQQHNDALPYGHPRLRGFLASQMVRRLHAYTVIPLSGLPTHDRTTAPQARRPRHPYPPTQRILPTPFPACVMSPHTGP